MSAREAERRGVRSGLRCHLDVPASGARVYADAISISGWLHGGGDGAQPRRLRAWLGHELIAETELLFVRPDVCQALGLSPNVATGFRLLGRSADARAGSELRVTASWSDNETEIEAARVNIELIAADPKRPYADVLHPEQRQVMHRSNIYGSGPPVDQPSAEALDLVRQYLPAQSSVLDVGCGAGAYAGPLLDAGSRWLGVEIDETCWRKLEERALPFRRLSDRLGRLPCDDGEFENAICIEVLEHIADPHAFLREIARAIRQRALFSVPNMEVLPYFSEWQVVPWHLLEGDHKNFFTRTSLRDLLRQRFQRVEVFSYGEHPLRTPAGLPLHVHLFAIAEK